MVNKGISKGIQFTGSDIFFDLSIPDSSIKLLIPSTEFGQLILRHHVPPGSVLAQDAGFQGFRPEGVAILQPTKKPRGGELTYADKVRNRLISGLRVRIEHAIGGVKRYRLVKDKLRNWKTGGHPAI